MMYALYLAGCISLLRLDHRPASLRRQNRQQHRVRHAAIDDVDGFYSGLGGVDGAGELGQHAA